MRFVPQDNGRIDSPNHKGTVTEAAIALEAAERWSTPDIVIEHRIGNLGLGDASVAIAVAHPHRAEAYEASRYIIEELKRRLPVWKREHYVDGRSEWVHAAG